METVHILNTNVDTGTSIDPNLQDFSAEIGLGAEAVKNKIWERNLSLDDQVICNGKQDKNVLQMCLQDVNNGHQIVKEELDKLVSRDGKGIKVQIGKLYRPESKIQSMVANHIIVEMKKTKEGSFASESLTELIEHPVISALIIEKWKRTRIFYFIQTRIYMTFLLLFSMFIFLQRNNVKYIMEKCTWNTSKIWEICKDFNKDPVILDQLTSNKTCLDHINTNLFPENYSSRLMIKPKPFTDPNKSTLLLILMCGIFIINTICHLKKYIDKIRGDKPYKHLEAGTNLITVVSLIVGIIILALAIYVDTNLVPLCPHFFLDEWSNGFSYIEVLFLMFTIYLLLKEIPFFVLAFCSPLPHHLDSQRCMESFSIVSAFLAMIYKGHMTIHAWPSGIIALGFLCSWMLFILKYGQSRFSLFGSFISLFWNILSRMYTYLLVILYTIAGFSISFWALEHQLPKNEYTYNYIKFLFTTLTASMGEFDLREGFIETYKTNTIILIFALLLLAMMIVIITTLMLNLFIANIIRDHELMMKDVYIDKLVFMANYSYCMEYFVFNMWPIKCFTKMVQELLPYRSTLILPANHEVSFCTSRLCQSCTGTHLKPHYNNLVKKFEEILQKDNNFSSSLMNLASNMEEKAQMIRSFLKEQNNL